MYTAFITHPTFFAHEVPDGHPECARRLTAINDHLHACHVYDLLQHYQAPRAKREQIARVHSARLVDALSRRAPSAGFATIDADTFMGVHTLDAAWHAAGAAVLATTLVVEQQVKNAFCSIRPPGHHVQRDRAMGFCFFNNVAIAAAHALATARLERVAILDFDVHHGNGTEDIFATDERVLLCSVFQHPFYPFSGTDEDRAHIIKTPLPAGTGGDVYRATITERWLPALDRFKPQMVFVSAGFDGHLEDTLAHFRLVDNDYLWLTETIVNVAQRYAGGRIVSCLEGGYALDALGRCVCLHVRTMAGI